MGLVSWIHKNIPCLLSRRTAFMSMIFLLSTFFFVEIIVGYMTNSMALVADAFHMLSDVASLIVGYLALKYSNIQSPDQKYTFGYARAEVLGALVNAVFLVALCFSIFIEAMKRLVMVESIDDPMLVFTVGAIGLVVNAFGMFLFHQQGFEAHGHSHGGGGGHGHSHGSGTDHGHSHGETKDDDGITLHNGDHDAIEEANEPLIDKPTKSKAVQKSGSQLNISAVYLHILGDALGSVIVMISAVVIMLASGRWTLYVDPVMSILIVIIILKTSIPLLKETSLILMQTVPTHLKLHDIKTKLIKTFPDIRDVHELHVWQLSGDKIIASVHVKFATFQDYMSKASEIKEFFHEEGIHSTTIQLEFENESEESNLKRCLVVCGEDCADQSCCKPE